MLSKSFKILFFSILFVNVLYAQKLDSLLKVISLQKEDSSKIINYATVAYIYSFSDREISKDYYDSTLFLSQKIGYLKGEGLAYQGIGEYYYYSQNWDDMKYNLQQAENVFLKIKDLKRYSSIQTVYAAYFEKIGDLEQALRLRVETLQYYEKTNETVGQSQVLGGIALLLTRMKRFDEAKTYYLKSASLRIKNNDKRGASIALLNLGAMLSDQDKIDEASIYLNKCLEIQEELGDQIIVTAASANLARIYNKKGAFEVALKLSKKCLEVYTTEEDSSNMVIARLYIAESYLGLKKFDKSIQQLDSVVIPKYENALFADLYGVYYEVYKKMGNYSKALEYLEKVRVIENENSIAEVQDKVSELKEQYETEKKEIENQQLIKANELSALKLKTNQYLFVAAFLFFILIVTILLLIARNTKTKARENQLQLQQKLLRSQMNPHFLYNALSSIQHYMYANDSEKAGDFLSSFARLSRGILEYSQVETISLEKELKWLKDYVNLQQLRFENEVDFSLNIDETIDNYNTQVPPMLVQPFIENAFEHGFRNIERKGKLEVVYKKNNESIIIQITDNGRGFDKNEQVNKNHVSQAIKITQERLDLLNKGKNKKVQIKVLSEIGIGTTISFVIPYITLK